MKTSRLNLLQRLLGIACSLSFILSLHGQNVGKESLPVPAPSLPVETSQQSDYLKSFDWMVKTFEENDAGFKYYLEAKGADNLAQHTAIYRAKMQQAKTEKECLSLMNDWLNYFRKGHTGVMLKAADPILSKSTSLSESDKDSIRAQFANEERVDITEPEFAAYLQKNKNTIDPIEGVWKTANNTIGIIRSKSDANKFDLFVIKADSIFWMPGQKRGELTLQKDGTWAGTFSKKDHSKMEMVIKWVGSSHGIISMPDFLLSVKQSPKVQFSTNDSLLAQFALATQPFIKRLSASTLYLRLPSFWLDQKEKIDKLLSDNDWLIRSTPNLIIDIRNGTGGSDCSHQGLIPYYYTQPIRLMGQTYLATTINAEAYEGYAKSHKDSSSAMNCNNIAERMRKNIGEYLDFDSNVGIINSFKRSTYPSKVAILCNRNNASADEQLLYAARQSYKVKIFGEPTSGAFDFSNVNVIDFPNGKYVLWVAMTASKRYPTYKIDDIGIQPDFFIDSSIKPENWIDFVQSTIEAQ